MEIIKNMSIIVAVAENGAIGKNNALLWHIREDLKRFKVITTGHPVIMGRNTFLSIGRPLPDRKNIVITRHPEKELPGCLMAGSLSEAVALCNPEEEAFVIGGAQIYHEAINRCDRLYLTRVHRFYEGDTFFPEISAEIWQKTWQQTYEKGEDFPYSFSFENYIRKTV